MKHRACRNKKCTQCELHEGAMTVCMLGDGKLTSKIVIVGEAPGRNEDMEGKPFVGRSGALLIDAMLDLGYPRQKLFITNAVRCRPPDNKTPNNKQIKACNVYLHKELSIIKPKMIIVLGNVAMRAVIKKSGITKYNGKMFTYEGDGWSCNVVPAFHPAYCSRYPNMIEPFVVALTRAVGEVEGVIKRDKIKWKLAMDMSAVKKIITAIKKKGRVAFDIEADSLYWWKKDTNLVSIGFSWKKGTGSVIPMHHDETPFTKKQQKRIYHLLRKHVFENAAITKIAHNLKFDMHWMEKYNVRMTGPIYDTMYAHYLLDENRRHGLDDISLQITNYGDYWHYVEKYGIKRGLAASIKLKKLAKYNAIDCDVCYKLFLKTRKQLAAQPELKRVFDIILMPAIRTFAEMETNGMLIDTKYLKKLEKKFVKAIDTQKEKLIQFKICQRFQEALRQEKDDYDFVLNFNSHDQVRQLMFTHKSGFKYTVQKDYIDRQTNVIGTGKDILIDLSTKKRSGVFASELMELKKLVKLNGTYVSGMWHWLDENNYVHPNFNLIGTVTGRPSCKEPNVQTIPRKDLGDYDTPLKKLIKRMFIAPKGYVLVEGDQSQIELRTMADMANDATMIKAFKAGQDIHSSVAARINNKHIDDVTEDERHSAKTTNFATIYGVGAHQMAKEMSRPKIGLYYTSNDTQIFIDDYFVGYPAIKQKIIELQAQADADGYVSTLFGRKRRLPDIKSHEDSIRAHALRQAVNAPIQGTAVDFTVLGANILAGYVGGKRHLPKGVKPVNMVHDSLMYYVPIAMVKKTSKIIKRVGENLPTKKYFDFKLGVPLVVDIANGKNWKNMKESA